MHFARNYTCGRTAFMGDIVQYTSPYLFPFVIEYSFIAAAVLIAMWKSVGKNPRYVQGYSSGHGTGFVVCFLKVPLACLGSIGLGKSRKTLDKTFPMT